MAIAAGSLWFVWAIDRNVNVANRTNHKFPAATATGVPCEVKSTVNLDRQTDKLKCFGVTDKFYCAYS